MILVVISNFFLQMIQGLDALGLATLDSLTSAMPAPIPFAASTSVSSLTEEDLINLRTLRRLMLLLSGFQRTEGSMVVRIYFILHVESIHSITQPVKVKEKEKYFQL